MEKLNQLAISKVVGSTIEPVGSVGFGNFNLLSTTEELQDALKGEDQDQLVSEFGYKEDAKVVEAFEAVRSGAPTDELLWNKDLAKGFVAECKRLRLMAPQAYLIRRLLNVRKNATEVQRTRDRNQSDDQERRSSKYRASICARCRVRAGEATFSIRCVNRRYSHGSSLGGSTRGNGKANCPNCFEREPAPWRALCPQEPGNEEEGLRGN